MTEWKPIKTAPRDRVILVAGDNVDVCIPVRYNVGYYDYDTGWFTLGDGNFEAGVMDGCGDGYTTGKYVEPTWWMDIPAIPVDGDDE